MASADTVDLLDVAYHELGYSGTDVGVYASDSKPAVLGPKDWIEKGDWLEIAKRVGAEKVFFLGNSPVVVFARHKSSDPEVLREFYNKIWCMARPRFLFLAKPGELAVYDLAEHPIRTAKEWAARRPLNIARAANEVATALREFRREQLESGRLFEERRFGDLKNRADKALIRDLKAVRRDLIKKGLGGDNLKFAHALIGRSIFIRYLEDRGILTEDYFRDSAKGHPNGRRLLDSPPSRSGLDFTKSPSYYARVLADKEFTFSLFRRLARDFNGDMFPDVDQEYEVIKQEHLTLVQDLLYGDAGSQKSLFFYAYRFDVVPIELISSIYEEFYQEQPGKRSEQGAFYTPPALVEFLLSPVLTPERLSRFPRIVDPACGSGIFLVESFRRIVRHRVFIKGRRLRFDELQEILETQLGGIDLNPEAIRIAAFSLYLALLHYVEPPDIRAQMDKGNRLPNLVAAGETKYSHSFNTLLARNAFDTEKIEASPNLNPLFSSNCADVVVGNPPWGAPGPNDREARANNKVAMTWCEKRRLPVGDQERSQAFIWRALDLLRPNGIAGLLVSTGLFFKHHPISQAFREKCFAQCVLDDVFNFAHTRRVYFKGAISPFAGVILRKVEPSAPYRGTHYWSAKRTRAIEGLQSVVFSRSDLKVLRDDDAQWDHRTWKILWWGNHRDKNLIQYLALNPTLKTYTAPGLRGQGYKESNQQTDSDWLKRYKELPAEHFKRYGLLRSSVFRIPPDRVERLGVREIYDGNRLLVKRGIDERAVPKGQVVARYESEPFCFTNAIHGVKLANPEDWQYRILLGILWSSVARYFFFLTSGNWGIWHHEIHLEDELLELPVRFPDEGPLRERILDIVDELRNYSPREQDVLHPGGDCSIDIERKRLQLETQLDEAMFDLYGLSDPEIDLIRDMCNTNLKYLYSPEKGDATEPVLTGSFKRNFGTMKRLPAGLVGEYLQAFMDSWRGYLDETTELNWQVYAPAGGDSMLAAIFSVQGKGTKPQVKSWNEKSSWEEVLAQLAASTTQPLASSRIYIEGLVRAVTDEHILIIKRNEKRFWTRSMAREDAEATLVQAMNRKSVAANGKR